MTLHYVYCTKGIVLVRFSNISFSRGAGRTPKEASAGLAFGVERQPFPLNPTL
jgi:hypothetical protein